MRKFLDIKKPKKGIKKASKAHKDSNKDWREIGRNVVSIFAIATLALSFLYYVPIAEAKASADLDQCANGGVGDPEEQCVGSAWQNGNLNANQAHYKEGQFVPYRITVSGIAMGTHSLIIEFDVAKSDKHAIDYIGSFDATETDADPCSDVIGGCDPGIPDDTFSVPVADLNGFSDASLNTFTGTQESGDVSIWNGTINSVSYSAQNVAGGGDVSTSIEIEFDALDTDVVIAWGGHIASRFDWGDGNSAGGISGSPYHMRILELDGSGGHEDRSLSAQAVLPPGNLTVVKQVVNDDGGTLSASDFTINIDGVNPSQSSFFGSASGTAITLDDGSFEVTETPPQGYEVTYDGDCSGTISQGDSLTCTVINDDIPATLMVTKVVVNDDGGDALITDFDLYVDDTQVTSGESNEFSAGAYVVSEANGPDGYEATFEGNCDAGGNISLEVGGEYECTIINDDDDPTQGDVTITKVVVGGDAKVSDFTLYVGETEVASEATNAFDPGEYVISEDGPEGYEATFSGNCDEEGNLTVQAGGEYTCTITNTIKTVTLTVTTSGDGEGDVTSDDEGIYCDSEQGQEENDCTETYEYGTEVTLTANAHEGSTFDNSWSGDGCSGNNPVCVLTMDQNREVDAHFTIVSSNGGGGGGGTTSSGGGGGGGGPAYSASIDFDFVAEKTVLTDASETVVLTNTGFSSIPAGNLIIEFPAVLEISSTSPSAASIKGNEYTWSVPQLNPNDTFEVSFVVVPQQTAVNIVTEISYQANSSQLVFTSGTENVVEVLGAITSPPQPAPQPEPEVEGAQTLPRTGINFDWVLMLGALGFLYLAGQRNRLAF